MVSLTCRRSESEAGTRAPEALSSDGSGMPGAGVQERGRGYSCVVLSLIHYRTMSLSDLFFSIGTTVNLFVPTPM